MLYLVMVNDGAAYELEMRVLFASLSKPKAQRRCDKINESQRYRRACFVKEIPIGECDIEIAYYTE